MRWLDELNGHESEQALGGSEGWGSQACCSPGGHKESDRTEQLNNKRNRPDAAQRVRLNQAGLSRCGLVSSQQ